MKTIKQNKNTKIDFLGAEFLTILFCVSLVVSNVVTGKIMRTPFEFFGFKITVPGGFICYALTYLISDVIGEKYGKARALLAVKYGFVCQIISCILIFITQILPPADSYIQASYEKLMGINYALTLASLFAYAASQSMDVWIFHKIKAALEKKFGKKLRGIWNTVSTLSSQAIDTVLFIGIGFGIGFGWLFDAEKWPLLFATMLGQYIIKVILAIFDTPIFYLMTRK